MASTRIILINVCFLFWLTKLGGQNIITAENSTLYHLLDRIEIKFGRPAIHHSSIKPYLRTDAVSFARLAAMPDSLSKSSLDHFDIQYVYDDNNEWLYPSELSDSLTENGRRIRHIALKSEQSNQYTRSRKPIFGTFYRTPANLFEINKKDFYFRANPMIDFQMAKAQDAQGLILMNRRGLELRGGVDDRIYFYTNLLETQARFPDFVNDRIRQDRAVPGAGLFKNYESDIFKIDDGYDFLTAQAYFGFQVTQHVGIQLGHGRQFIGNGYRSLFLSNFANNYFYLRLNWRVWNLHLQNIFGELSAEARTRNNHNQLVTKKYFAAHHLSYNISPNLNVGLFETVVFSRNEQFEFQYLNPFILYRTVESAIGSPDNILLGLDAKWNFLRRFQLYGQVIFDEFKFDELFLDNRGWWANKYGTQLGLKYVDVFGIDHLDLQLEWNVVRPYTYSHRDSAANYAHFHQAMAHPLGANFKEQLLKIRYQPLRRFEIDARLFMMRFGEDPDSGVNWGGNILLPNVTRAQNFGNETGQGIDTKVFLGSLDISYRLFHNCYLDLRYFYRHKKSAVSQKDHTTQMIGGGFRLNTDIFRMEF